MKKIAYIELDTHAEIAGNFLELMKNSQKISVDYYFSEKILNLLGKKEKQNIYQVSKNNLLELLKNKSYDLVIIGTVHRYFNVFLKISKFFPIAIIGHNLNFIQASEWDLLKSIFRKGRIFRLKLLLKEGLLYKRKIYEKAKESIPGGVNSPVRAFQSVDKEYPIFIKSGNGSKLYDEDGNEYVDMIGSWGPIILGHNYPKVLEVVKKELEKGTSFGLPTKKEVELAELVKSCFPSIEKLRLTTSGTEAAMASVRVARAFTGKNKIIKFEGCYHGHSDSLLVKAGSGLLTFEHQDSNGITEGVVKDTITLPFGDFDKLKKTLENDNDIACVIIEPIPANMGLIETEKEYLEKVREITKEKNVVLIFDEVISGFRVSLGGAQKVFGITPDLTILGKIIGGGYPVGGFGGKKEIMNLISPVGNVYHAGTLSGNPISVAAGIETISILKENPEIYENVNKKTENLVNKINELIKKYNIPASVNYFGSLFTIFFSKEKVKTLEGAINTNDEFYSIYFDTMLENGVIVPPSKYEAHFVSYIHNDEDVEKLLKGVEKTFQKIAEKLK